MHSITVGSKAQVWHGTALKTAGGLQKSDLMMNKHDRIVSKKKHSAGKKLMKKMMKSPRMRKIFKANQQKIKSKSKKRSKSKSKKRSRRSKRRDGNENETKNEM